MCGLALGVRGWVPVFKRGPLAVPWQGLLEKADCFFLHLLGSRKPYGGTLIWDPPLIRHTRVGEKLEEITSQGFPHGGTGHYGRFTIGSPAFSVSSDTSVWLTPDWT